MEVTKVGQGRIIHRVKQSLNDIPRRKRVAAYCCVSTDKASMLHSLYQQISYYNDHIQKHAGWEYAGVYVDEGITGTKDERPRFQQMLSDCRAGKIDMILTKSISRFARNTRTVLETVRELKALGVDVYFEEQNMEAVKTNVLGTENVLTAAIEAGVEKVVCLSTDKAAYPVNAMGISKAMMEKVAAAKARVARNTKICFTRYGNVLCSRGSVIPLWIDQIKNGNPISITEPSMTRFIMSLDEAIGLVLFAFEHGESGDILVQKAPACTLQTLAEAVCELFGRDKKEIKIIGIRHGEKLHETLLSNEECAQAVDLGDFYRVPCDKRGLNYEEYFSQGNTERINLTEFNSHNTAQLTVEEIMNKLKSLPYIQTELARMGH